MIKKVALIFVGFIYERKKKALFDWRGRGGGGREKKRVKEREKFKLRKDNYNA